MTDTLPIDSIAASVPAQGLAQLKDLSLDQVISSLATDLSRFAISLAAAILVFYVGRFIITRL